MKHNEIEKRLADEMIKWEIIDCHEHLSPEQCRLETAVDVFTLFAQYTHGDLVCAGMTQNEYQSLFNQDIPLDARWKKFAPFWEKIRYASYSRAVLIAVEKFFGFDDITGKNCVEISRRIKESNTPGIYDRVIGKACNIRMCLTQCARTDTGTGLLTPLMPMMYNINTWQDISRPPFDPEAGVRTLDDYCDAMRRYVIRVKKEGAVGLKWRSQLMGEPNRTEALALFEKVKTGTVLPANQWPNFADLNPLMDYFIDYILAIAAEQEMVVAVHTGYWGDFRKLDPLHIIPMLQRHPNVRFDVYHLGYPWLRETIMLGKGFPNVWLNLAWTHIISQRFAMDGIDELLDTVPVNKVLAFGGDYNVPVEKIYGHLTMARENIARVFGRRIAEGRMTEDQALRIAKMWFWENPVNLYRLKV